MANIIQIKRRSAGGAAGAPASLKSGEIAYNEADNITYYGFGDDGGGNATSIIAIAGLGAYLNLTSTQTVSGDKTFTGAVNVGAPTLPDHAANKAYVDAAIEGLDVKASVVAATTANITLSGEQTIDGKAVVAGDRVLVKNQTSAAENGIYIVVGAASWTRSDDANEWSELVHAFTFVESGTINGSTSWLCNVQPGGTLGTTDVTWTQFGSAAQYTAGTGLDLTGNEFSLADTAVTPGSFGSASQSLQATVDQQGRLTSLAATDIQIDCGTF